jgi:hypothetical protein
MLNNTLFIKVKHHKINVTILDIVACRPVAKY